MDLITKTHRDPTLLFFDLDDTMAAMFSYQGFLMNKVLEEFYKPRITTKDYMYLKEIIEREKEPLCYDYRSDYNTLIHDSISLDELRKWHYQNTDVLLDLPAYDGIDQGIEEFIKKHGAFPIHIITNRADWWGNPSIVYNHTLKWIEEHFTGVYHHIKCHMPANGDKREIAQRLISEYASIDDNILILEDSPMAILQYLDLKHSSFQRIKIFVVSHNWNRKTVFDVRLTKELLDKKEKFLKVVESEQLEYIQTHELAQFLSSI